MEAEKTTEKTTEKISIRGLFQSKNFTLLLSANFISRFGDSVDSIAYSWMVYLLTGSKLLLGTLFAVNALPNILFSPFTGILADRYPKKRLILLGYLGRGITVSITAFLFATHMLKPWHLFLFTIINSTLETVSMPAVTSLLPLILKREAYLAANSFASSAYRFAELLGAAAAGMLIAVLGISGAIFIDGATFFIAAFIFIFLRFQQEFSEVQSAGIKGYLQDLSEAIHFIWSRPLMRITLFLFAMVNFCLTPLNVMMPVYVKDILSGGPEILSAISIAFLVGIILGGLAVSQYGSGVSPRIMILLSLGALGGFYSLLSVPAFLTLSALPAAGIACFSFFSMGVLIPSAVSPIQVYIMKNTEKSMMGRIGALMGMISCIAIPIGASATGIICQWMPLSFLFLLMGAIIILTMLVLGKSQSFSGID